MRNGDAVIMLVELRKGLLHPAVSKEGTFKELVKRPALTDSEYDIEVAMGDTLENGALRSSLMGGQVGTGHENRGGNVLLKNPSMPSSPTRSGRRSGLPP